MELKSQLKFFMVEINVNISPNIVTSTRISSNDSVEMTTAWQEARLGFENRTTSGTEIYS